MHPLSIPYHLYQAVGEFVIEEEMYLSDHHPMDQAVQEALSTARRIQGLLTKLLVKQSVVSVITSLKESKVDYTLLLFLQLPDSIKRRSELISCLESTCTNMKADFESRYFYECIWSYFESEGVLPITPDKYVVANSKEEILKEYERVKKSWGIHNPLFLQMYDTKDGKFTNHLYIISRTACDGILWFLACLKEGAFVVKGKMYTTCGAFEHVVGPSTLTRQLYDCEIMSSVFDGKKSTEEIEEMVKCFPQCISSIMIDKNLMDIETFITFEVKNRTRILNDGKV